MCLIRPIHYRCCKRIYIEVTRLSSGCPDAWPLEKCPEELCIIQDFDGGKVRTTLGGTCWRCQAVGEGLDGERYEARRPPIDNAFVVEGLKNCSSEGRRKRAEHAGNCWHCGASSDGIRDCEACDGTGSAQKGKKKFAEDTPTGRTKKRRRTPAIAAAGGAPKPRRGRPPGGGKKKKLAAIKEEGHMNPLPPSVNGNTSLQKGEFQPDIPEASYGGYDWNSANHHGDPNLPSYGLNIDDYPYPGTSSSMAPYTSNPDSLHKYGSVDHYTLNPQEMEYSSSILAHQDHLRPSIELDHDASHGEPQIGDVGEGVRSDHQAHLGNAENQFVHFPNTMLHTHDGQYLTHDDWPDYEDGFTYPRSPSPSRNTNNEFAPAVHDTHSSSVAPVV